MAQVFNELTSMPAAIYELRAGVYSLSSEPELYQRLIGVLVRGFPSCDFVVYTWKAEEERLNEKARSSNLPNPTLNLESLQARIVTNLRAKDASPLDDESSHQILGLPLLHEEAIVGAVVILDPQSRLSHLVLNEKMKLQALGNTIAAHIHNHWLFERWATLVEAEREILTSSSAREVFDKALRKPNELLDFSACWAFVPSESRNTLKAYVGPGVWKQHKRARTVAESAQRTRDCVVQNHHRRSRARRAELCSFIALPLMHEGTIRAIMVFASKAENRFTTAERFFLQRVAQSALYGLLAMDSRVALYNLGILGASAATLVHDLGDYSTSIANWLGQISSHDAINSDQDLQRYAGRIEEHYRRITELLETESTFLSQAKRDPNLTKDVVDVPQCVLQFVRREEQTCLLRGIKLGYTNSDIGGYKQSSFIVRCNELLLGRFLTGMIKNSVAAITKRATDPRRRRPSTFNGRITIETAPEDNMVNIIIKDNGVGFYGLRGLDYKPRGRGFLLPLAKDVIERFLGGKVEIVKKNEEGGGTLVISLPVARHYDS